MTSLMIVVTSASGRLTGVDMPYTLEQIGARAKERNPEAFSKFSDREIGERLVQRNPEMAALVAKPKEEKKKKSTLRKVGDFFTGSTQKFAETLGAAAAQATGVADDINQSKIREAEARFQLSKIRPRTMEQAQRIKSQLAQGPNVPLATEAIPALTKSGKQVFGEALGTGLEATTGGLLSGAGKTGALQGGKIFLKPTAKTLGQAVGRGAATGAAYGGLGGVSQGLQADKDLAGIAGAGLSGAATGAALGGALGAVGYGIGKIPQKLDAKSEDIYRKVLKMSPTEIARETQKGKNTPVLLKNLGLTGDVAEISDDLNRIYGGKEDDLTNLLTNKAKAGASVSTDEFERAAMKSLEGYKTHVAEYGAIESRLKTIIDNTRKLHGDAIPVDVANQIKRGLWQDSFNVAGTDVVNDATYKAGSAMKKLIERAVPEENIAAMNAELGQFVVAAKQLTKSSTRAQSGVMRSRLGAIIGGILGLPGGPFGAAGGAVAGSQIDKYLLANPTLRTQIAQILAKAGTGLDGSVPPVVVQEIKDVILRHLLIQTGFGVASGTPE